jgi:cobaltochelatase CobS
MSSATHATITRQAQLVQIRQPRLSTGAYVSSATRADLDELAALCGVPYSVRQTLNDNDLLSVYLVALKSPEAATRTAAKLTERHSYRDDGPTLPPLPAPDILDRDPPAPRAPRAPKGPVSAPEVDRDAIRALIKEEVQEGALKPLQTLLESMDARTDTLLDGAIATARDQAVSAMREVVAEEAHKAASAALKAMQPTRLDVVMPSAPEPVSLGLVHFKTPLIISALAAGVNVYLHGPAGSGKTTVARKAAEAFGLAFYFAAKVESEYQLLGFKDAKGDTVRTPFREAYEHGGVFLFDEMDASSPSAVVALNAALANGLCPFPDKTVERHADFRCIGAGNTKLTGATRAYAGRNQLDAASIDRFAFIEFGYDDDLERALASDVKWCAYVQAVRQAVADRGLNHLVTPRATYDGCKLLAAGFDWDTVAAMVMYKGLDAATVTQLQTAVKGR